MLIQLSTLHHCQQFKKEGEKQVAKFFPHYDGPYDIIVVHMETSNYTLKLPNSPNTYLTYHTSKLKAFLPNYLSLFLSCKPLQPSPIITPDGFKEFLIQEIINSQQHDHSSQYLM